MSHNHKFLAGITILLAAAAAGCGGASPEDEDLGGCIEVAGEDGTYVECPDPAAGDESDEQGPGASQEAYLPYCTGASSSAFRCIPVVMKR